MGKVAVQADANNLAAAVHVEWYSENGFRIDPYLVTDSPDHFCRFGFFHGAPGSRATDRFETASAALSRSYL